MSRKEWNDFKALAPAVNSALLNVSNAVQASGLDAALVELVKLYASQINGCAFCIQFHATEARNKGVKNDRLHLLGVWRDAQVFSERERAALLWTETLTLLNAHHEVNDSDYDAAREHFSDKELAHLTAAVSLINAWNRIAKAYQFTPVLTDCESTEAIKKQNSKDSQCAE